MDVVLEQAAQRFPLIPRPRPACPPLTARVAALCDLADAAAHRADADHLALAAETLNKAALIASDCGVPGLARSLCWRHFTIYRLGWPLGGQHARRALEPLVNLARLAIRAGNGFGGYQLIENLLHAVSSGGRADIDGRPVSFDSFTRTSDDLRMVRQWLYGVFVAEGIRALISSSRWQDAVTHAQQYRGVGERLLDGRQAAVVAHCLAGHADTAAALLAGSTLVQPWEHAVADCLAMLCDRSAGHSTSNIGADLQRHYLELDRTPELVVFRTRLGLTILDLADADRPLTGQVFACLISDLIATADGYAARDALSHQGCRTRLTTRQQRALASAVESAGLRAEAIPQPLVRYLHTAVEIGEAVLARSLDAAAVEATAPASTVRS
ncbi:hypothetical protein FH608_023850 [Nonomuraea phyllanthi]|uniref:Uncharacterized protein n=1 Tax=Nonomuraea phyllanthi TaxID=2219224 RepID=A0A5C4WB50_9ACTN|nr:hypothetical protein [Nonomuraea phyllanthi]KAB8192543.1 hypothetical protein FH608_023850 [Nonomuraea phyllanthi]QFY08021.1 hypothetical protein GBF35_16240 [Nonomuraea phyllanthi]